MQRRIDENLLGFRSLGYLPHSSAKRSAVAFLLPFPDRGVRCASAAPPLGRRANADVDCRSPTVKPCDYQPRRPILARRLSPAFSFVYTDRPSVLASFEREGHRRPRSHGLSPRRVSLDGGPRARRGSGVVLADRQGFRGVLHGAPVLPLPGAGEAQRGRISKTP